MTGVTRTGARLNATRFVACALVVALLHPFYAWSYFDDVGMEAGGLSPRRHVRIGFNTVRLTGSTLSAEHKLVASQGEEGDEFGSAVAIDGDTLVVGAPYNDGVGAAHVFIRQGGIWIEEAKLTAPDAAPDDRFGYSVAIDGDTVIVGARDDDHEGGVDAGSAYVFVRSSGEWFEQDRLSALDPSDGDYFGVSVAVQGNTAVVGAYGDNHGGSYADGGSAYVFVREDGIWNQTYKLTASDFTGNDEYFGRSVTIDGDVIVVGAHGEDHGPGWNQGAAYVFVRAGDVWIEQAKLIASDAAQADQFGRSAVIDGGTVLVGAWNADHEGETDAGAAYAFERPQGGWADMTETVKLTASDAANGDRFGASVAIDGDVALVGAHLDVDNGIDAGSAYVFLRSGSAWVEDGKLLASDAAVGDNFGYAVALCRDTLLVGAPLDDERGTDSGSACVFGPDDQYITGDLNCDGQVNSFDIDPFVLALTSPSQYPAAYPACDWMLADINEDGFVDNSDIDPFVDLVTGE